MRGRQRGQRRKGNRRTPAWLASLLLSRCTPVALLNGFDRLYPSFDRARRAARGIRYGRSQRQALDVWVPTGPDAARESLPVVIFIYGVFEAFARKRKAADNPWGEGATTLEWTLSSPPPFHQFETLPRVQ